MIIKLGSRDWSDIKFHNSSVYVSGKKYLGSIKTQNPHGKKYNLDIYYQIYPDYIEIIAHDGNDFFQHVFPKQGYEQTIIKKHFYENWKKLYIKTVRKILNDNKAN